MTIELLTIIYSLGPLLYSLSYILLSLGYLHKNGNKYLIMNLVASFIAILAALETNIYQNI